MSNIPKKHNPNAAFTIVELIAAMMVVSLCIAAFVKIAHLARQQRDYGREHQTAVDQVQNVLEILAVADPEQLTMGNMDLMPYERLIERSLPDGKLLVTCEPLDVDGAAADVWRLDARVSWKPGANLPQRSVALTRLLSKPQLVEEGLQEEESAASDEEAEQNTGHWPLATGHSEEEGGEE